MHWPNIRFQLNAEKQFTIKRENVSLSPIEPKHSELTNKIELTLSDRLLSQAQSTFARSSYYFLHAARRVQANNCDPTNRTDKEMLLK
jgi:hypothetical protein